jgi:hypothetical protein
VAALAVLFWPKQAAAAAALLSWKNTGPTVIKPKKSSPVALTYTGQGNRLVGTDPDALVVSPPETATDYAGTPVLDLDDPNAIPLY